MAGHGGCAWKVAYADFVTAMMAFFMVMWITAQSKDVKTAVSEYFKNPSGAGRRNGGMSLIDMKHNPTPSTMKRTTDGPKPKGRGQSGPGVQPAPSEDPQGPSDKARLLILHGGKYSSVGSVVPFADNSAEIGDEEKAKLKNFIPMLLGKPNKIEVRGHTSRRPLPSGSSFHDAWDLSFARCLAVMKVLEEGGVELARIRLSQAGAYEPKTLRVDSKSQAENSRVEIYMLNEFAEESVGTPEERAKRFTDH
jgi:chemotaxis protein MotB